MKFKKVRNLEIKTFKSREDCFKFVIEEFDKFEVTIPFCKIRHSRKQKSDVFDFLKEVLKLEESLNKEATILIDDNYKDIVKEVKKNLFPKKMVIGIALGGGGARGALQVGQLKALEEFGLLKDYDCMVGTSIGSINMSFLISSSVEELENKWLCKQQKMIFKRRGLKEALFNIGLFDRNETRKYLSELIDENKFDVNYPSYYINTFSLKSMQSKVFNINHHSKNRILDACLASSAIPLVYGISKYNNDLYVDGGLTDSQSIKSLINKGCNVIFAASLSVYPKCSSYSKDGICIIDLGSVNFYKDIITGTFSFDRDIKEKIEHGYDVSSTLLSKLDDLGILDIIRRKDVTKFYKLDNYYNLPKEENHFIIKKHLL